MKIFISSDMEGTTGIAHWDETEKGKPLYDHFANQMSREVAAACEGALAAGAEDVLVKDAHDSARNINPELLPEQARIFRSWGAQPFCMMAGLDESFDGVVFTGYHSPAGTDWNPLAHTMELDNNYVKINGEICSELMINSLTASYVGVPVYCVTGDAGLCRWFKTKVPEAEVVETCEGCGNGSISIHPDLAVKRIREAVMRAVVKPKKACMYPMPKHFDVEICYKKHSQAHSLSFYPGAELVSPTVIRFAADDYMDVLRFFHFVL